MGWVEAPNVEVLTFPQRLGIGMRDVDTYRFVTDLLRNFQLR